MNITKQFFLYINKKNMTIKNLYGETVEITNLTKAIKQAENAVAFNEQKIKENHEIQFPQALKEWKHILSELKKIDNADFVGSPQPFQSDDVILNTLTMLKVKGINAVIFADATKCIHTTISPKARKEYNKLIFETKIQNKTFKQWINYFVKKHKTREFNFESIQQFQIKEILTAIVGEVMNIAD